MCPSLCGCETCDSMDKIHAKHTLRRKVNAAMLRIRVESDPEAAKRIRISVKLWQAEYEAY